MGCWVGETIGFAKRQAKVLASIGAAILLIFVLASTRMGRTWWTKLRIRWPFRPWSVRTTGPESAVRFYGDLLTRLEKMGFRRAPGATPAEYAHSLESLLPGLSELTRLYYHVRFGGFDLGGKELARAGPMGERTVSPRRSPPRISLASLPWGAIHERLVRIPLRAHHPSSALLK